MLLNTNDDYSHIFFNSLQDVLQQEGAHDLLNLSNEDIIKAIKAYQNRIRENVPIPRNKEDEKSASLTYLDKIRAASQMVSHILVLEELFSLFMCKITHCSIITIVVFVICTHNAT